MWCAIWEIEGAGSPGPRPLCRRNSQFQVCCSVRSSGGRWRPARWARAGRPPPIPLALERDTKHNHSHEILCLDARADLSRYLREIGCEICGFRENACIYDWSLVEANKVVFDFEWTAVTENDLSVEAGGQRALQYFKNKTSLLIASLSWLKRCSSNLKGYFETPENNNRAQSNHQVKYPKTCFFMLHQSCRGSLYISYKISTLPVIWPT